MAVKTNSQRLIEARSRRTGGDLVSPSAIGNTANTSGNLSNSEKLKKRKLEREAGVDTFASDLNRTNSTLADITSSWQTQETMANTKSAVESMYNRTSAFQDYASKYSPDIKGNVAELNSYYKNVLDNWDSLANTYGMYQDADSYTKETTKLRELYSMSKEDLESYVKGDNPIAYTTYGGQDITWKSLYDEKVHKEMASSKEAVEGWKKFTADETASQEEKKKTSWMDTVLEGFAYSSDTTLPTANISKVVNDKRKDTSYTKPTDEWTQEEKNVFGAYYLDDPEKAYEYATNLNNSKNVAKEEAQKQAITDNATSGFWAGAGHTLGSLASAPLGLADYLDDVTSYVAGKPIMSDGFVSPFEYSQTVQGGISNKLNEMSGIIDESVPILGGKGAGDIYGAGTSIAQSTMSRILLGPIGTFASYFGQSSASGVDDALARGGTDGQALLYGASLGSIEGALEAIVGDKASKLGASGTIGKFFSKVAGQGASEFTEEGLTTIFSNIADKIIMKDKSAFDTAVKNYEKNGSSKGEAYLNAILDVGEDALYDALVGFVSGAVQGAPQVLVNNAKLGKSIRDNGSIEDLNNLASELNIDDSYSKYIELINGGKIKNIQLGNLYENVSDRVAETYNSERETAVRRSILEMANEMGDSKNSGLISTAVQKKLDGQKLTEAESAVLKTDTAQGIMENIRKGGLRVNPSESFTDAMNKADRTKSVITPKSDNEKARQHVLKNLNKGEKTTNAEGKEVTIEGIKTENGATTLLTSEGEVSANDMTFSSNDAEIVSYAQNMPAEKANVFVAQYDGKTDVDYYVNSFEHAYSLGEAKVDLTEALKNKGALTEAQVLKAYEAGNRGRVIARQQAIDKINKQYSAKTFTKGKYDDSIIDYNSTTSDGSKVNWNSLSAKQQNAVTFVKGFSEATGVNIKFIQSKVKDGKHTGENGRYEASTNTIYIDVYAGRIAESALNDAIIPTVSHEVTHWMKEKAPALYAKMQDLILETLAEKSRISVNDLIASEKDRMKQKHPNMKVTDELAIDELVARGSEDMLSNSDMVRKMLAKMSKTEQDSFVAKVKETFSNLMQWINDLLAQYRSDSVEAKFLREYKDRMKELSKMWDEALAEAIKTNQNLQQEGITGEQVADESQYSDREITTISEEEYKEAKEFFGTTKNYKVAGYMLKDGVMLDFSGKHWGNPSSDSRDVDHRDIWDVWEHDDRDGTDEMVNMIGNGNIRLMPESGGINLAVKPTEQQIETLKKYIDHFKGEVIVDFDKAGGDTVESYTYNRGTSADRIIDEINTYFRGGRRSELAQFLQYSDREYMDAVNNGDMETAQKMVDEVAKQAGFTIRSYHGTLAKDFTEFKTEYIGSRFSYDDKGFFFTDNKKMAEEYATNADYSEYGRVLDVYLKVEKPLIVDEQFVLSEGLGNIFKENDVVYAWDNYSDFFKEEADNRKADGIIVDDGKNKMTIVFKPRQIKSAETITYDNYGNVVPLSRRFGFRADIRYSDRDSAGNTLTEGQKEYFKDSKVRDAEGNLLVMYHGTPNAGFTKFKSGTYFTEHKWYADVYQSPSASSISTKKSADNPDTYAVYLNIKKPFDTRNKAERDIFYNEYYRQWGTGTDLMESGLPDWLDGMDLQEFIEENGYDYDGLILDEGGVGGYGDEVVKRGLSYVVFNPEQVKNIDNENPTSDPDIRYSDREIIGPSGKDYGRGVYLDSTLLTGLTDSERKDMVKLFVTEELAGQHFVAYDSNNDAVDIGIAKKNDTFKNHKGKKRNVLKEIHNKYNGNVIKQEAIVLTNELVANARYEGSGISRYPHGWLDDNGKNSWDYWKVYLQEKDGTVWEAILNIANTANGERILYDIDPIKMVEEAIKSASTTTNDNIHPDDTESQEQFSDRDDVSVYDLMGEKEQLVKQNAELQADVARLKERLKLEKQLTKGNTFDEKKLTSVAKHLLNISKSNYSESELVAGLRDVYSYIVESRQVDWNDLYAKAYDVARNVLAEQREQKIENEYYKMILNDIRKTKIRLSEQQIAEAKYAFGNNYHKMFFGRITLSANGIDLDSKWQEWSSMYPEVFDAELSPADQITALYDIYDSVRESAVAYQRYNDEESIRALATEIYNQYWNVSTIRTTADKHDAEIKRLNYEHRKSMKRLRDGYKENMQKQALADRIHYGRIVNDVRNRKEAEIQRAKELGKKRVEAIRDRAETNAKIQKITKNALTLNEWLVKNNKDKHIPEPMKEATIQLISAIDFSSKQLLGAGQNPYQATNKDLRLSKALSKLHEVANNMKKEEAEAKADESIYMDLDLPDFAIESLENLRKIADNLADKYGDERYVLHQMSLEELSELDSVISTLKTAIATANKTFVIGQNEMRSSIANQLIANLDSLSEKKMDNVATTFFEYQNATPYYMLKRLGPVGERIYNVLMDAQESLVFMEDEIVHFVESVVNGEKIKEWSKEVHEFEVLDMKHGSADNPKYKTIKMTTAQIMSMYALSKRESAKLHLEGGGIRMTDIELNPLKKIMDAEGASLAPSELSNILSSLTAEQKQVADALQKFMSEKGAEWGNKVTMARWGINQFGEENYFPMDTVAQDGNLDNVGQKDNSIYRLLNMSFTKSLTQNANNQLVIDNIFDVFARHMTDMAKYSSFALPLLDTMKILGYSHKQFLDEERVRHNTISVASSIRRTFGKGGYSYIINLLKDLNGAEVTPRDEAITKKLMSNYKISAVGGNLRVALLQGTAYLKAGLVIEPKYLTQAIASNGLEGSKKAMKYSGIALWKSKGHYDLNISRSVAQEIKQDKGSLDKFREISLKGAEWGDKLTWGYLWNACELWAKDNTAYKYGSEEFNKAVAGKLREVIVKTQVVDSTLTRSQMMRSKSAMVQTLTAFMSESTMTYNMLSDAFFEWSLDARKAGNSYKSTFSKHGRKFASTIGVFTLTAFATALSGALVDAGRDDDEEKEFDEKYLEAFLESLGDNLNVFSSLPIIKDIVSIAQGYSPSRFDEQSFVNIFSGVKKWMKVAEGEGNVYSAFYKTLQGVSQLAGLPASNMVRDAVAMWNMTIGEMYPSLRIDQK